MSSLIELKVPDIGNVSDVEVNELLIKPGDVVALEQTILIMESDKATMDLPASAAGTIQDVLVKVGDKVSEGTLVATLLADTDRTPAAAETVKPEEETPSKPEAAAPPVVEPETEAKPEKPGRAPAPAEAPSPAAIETGTGGKAHATPAVRRFARELGVDIGRIPAGGGRKGRILKDDVQKFVKQALSSASSGGTGIPSIPAVDFTQFGEVEEKPLSKIKRLTGKNLSCNWLNLPMVTQHEEADITEMEGFRKTMNAELTSEGVKITPLVFIIKALLSAMKLYPQFNASLSPDGERLIYKKYFNIGVAVDTPNGLVVPVLRNADRKTLVELANELSLVSEKARQGKLMPADMQGGCMTISSLGGIGGTGFTPIVNAPEVAILGVARASMKPVWNGSEFVPRLMLPLDLTYDHRVIDGADGVRFTVAVARYLSDIRRLLL
ncbi:MAG: dihydrolipoyllysine-residue acetyltransferase [Gammaproteobacteria bacterium]